MATYKSKLSLIFTFLGIFLIIAMIGLMYFYSLITFETIGGVIVGISLLFGFPKVIIGYETIKFGFVTKNLKDITKIDIIKVTDQRSNMIIHFKNGAFIINRYDLFKDFLPELKALVNVKINQIENLKEKKQLKKELIILTIVIIATALGAALVLGKNEPFLVIIGVLLMIIVPIGYYATKKNKILKY